MSIFFLGPVCTLSTNSAVFFYALLTIEPLESAVEVFEATAVPRAPQYSVLLGTEHVLLQTSHGQEFSHGILGEGHWVVRPACLR